MSIRGTQGAAGHETVTVRVCMCTYIAISLAIFLAVLVLCVCVCVCVCVCSEWSIELMVDRTIAWFCWCRVVLYEEGWGKGEAFRLPQEFRLPQVQGAVTVATEKQPLLGSAAAKQMQQQQSIEIEFQIRSSRSGVSLD